jgi:hypothetical protein
VLASINVIARKVDFIFFPSFATAEPYRLRFKPQAAARAFDVLHGLFVQNIRWKNICQHVFALRATADKSLHPTHSFFVVRRRADRTMTLSQIVHLRALSHEYTLRRTLNRTLFLTTSAA